MTKLIKVCPKKSKTYNKITSAPTIKKMFTD